MEPIATCIEGGSAHGWLATSAGKRRQPHSGPLLPLLSSPQLVKTAELPPTRNYVLGSHPHGIICAGAFSAFCTEACGFSRAFPGLNSSLALLAGLFYLPVYREYMMSSGGKPFLPQPETPPPVRFLGQQLRAMSFKPPRPGAIRSGVLWFGRLFFLGGGCCSDPLFGLFGT